MLAMLASYRRYSARAAADVRRDWEEMEWFQNKQIDCFPVQKQNRVQAGRLPGAQAPRRESGHRNSLGTQQGGYTSASDSVESGSCFPDLLWTQSNTRRGAEPVPGARSYPASWKHFSHLGLARSLQPVWLSEADARKSVGQGASAVLRNTAAALGGLGPFIHRTGASSQSHTLSSKPPPVIKWWANRFLVHN